MLLALFLCKFAVVILTSYIITTNLEIVRVGDVLDTILAIMVLRSCQQVQGGLPKYVQAKMIFNIIIDFGIGLVPFLGDIADALFRANSKNALVLEGYLHKKSLTRQGAVV